MASVSYNECSFLIDGEPVWLVSGEVHYSRIPHQLWEDRLIKAKSAGLNCISTLLSWNYHEPQEGQWSQEGDRDVVAFVQKAKELGLYVILRPGPFVGGDFDAGGLPGWLATKSGMTLRVNNAAYTHYFDKYFRNMLNALAEQQVSCGGSIILIQNENHYLPAGQPERVSYLEFVNQLFRRSGFDVPIVTCNNLSAPALDEAVETVSVKQKVALEIRKLRIVQPHKPAFVSEYHVGAADAWGDAHQYRAARETARGALEILGCGAQCNYYMFAGGTNFGFWAGRLADRDDAFQVTSYDYDAPVTEGGGLSEKYYLLRLVNLLASHMGKHFARSVMDEPGAGLLDNTETLNIFGPTGRWAVITNNGRDEIKSARVGLPTGKEFEVSLEPIGAVAIPFELRLNAHAMLDYSSLMPLGLFKDRFLVLHGPAGYEGVVSINGKELSVQIPKSDEPKMIEHEKVFIITVNSSLAMRTWVVEDQVVFGPKFVGRNLEQVEVVPGAKHFTVLKVAEKRLSRKKLQPVSGGGAVSAPKLGPFRKVGICSEPLSDELAWEKMDRPRDVDRKGVPYGYAWYRLDIQAKRDKKHQLFLPNLEDRGQVFLNGAFLGTWGRGANARRALMDCQFKKGNNTLVVFADNLGRCTSAERLGELKGLYGQVFEAKLLRISKPKLRKVEALPKRIVPRHLIHTTPILERLPLWEAEISLNLSKVSPIHLSFAGVPHSVAVQCNDRAVALFIGETANFGDVTLGPELHKGKNVIRLLLWGDVKAKVLSSFALHELREELSAEGQWQFRAWTPPVANGGKTRAGYPTWFASRFKCPVTDVPLFAELGGVRKGQLFLNGHNLGRFWSVGPQSFYYLPECWLEEDNELLIFEEQGKAPSKCRLVYRPLGPYRQ